jgi:hypothetical protein
VIPWLHGCDLLEEDADEVLLGLLARDNEPPPHYVSRQPRQPAPAQRDFDHVGFRRHMERLIAWREARERQTFERERARLDALLLAEEEPPPKPTPAPKPQPVYKQQHLHPKQNVEPWFDLSRQPTTGDLRCIAQYALGYFLAVRHHPYYGSSSVGGMTTRVVCPRDADMVATALQRVRAEIPDTARLSAALLDVPEGLLAVTLGCPFVALRVASVEEGRKVSIEVTWDHGA